MAEQEATWFAHTEERIPIYTEDAIVVGYEVMTVSFGVVKFEVIGIEPDEPLIVPQP
jgi:hypothetical protein